MKTSKLGALPEWNLNDLYPGLDSPEIKRDLEQADSDCAAFEQDFKGRWPHWRPAKAPDARSPRRSSATRRSTTGSAGWSPMLRSFMPATPPIRCVPNSMATSGAHHRRFVASPVFHARTQPHRRCATRCCDARSGARPLPAVDRGCAQGKALSARRPGRGALPREVGDRLFRLESAVRRDHRGPAIQGRREIAGDRADAQLAAGRRRQETQGGGRSAGQDLQGEFAAIRADHQYARQGQGNFRPLARLQGHRRCAASVESRRAAKWSRRWSRLCAPPIRNCRTVTMR